MNEPHGHPIEDFDRGLGFDLQTLSRRTIIRRFGVAGLGAMALAACSTSSDDAATSSPPGSQPSTDTTAVPTSTSPGQTDISVATVTDEIPDETGGPFPGDGTNGANVLTENGIVRSDLTSSFGSSTTVAEGVALKVVLSIQDIANGGNALAGAAVYAWHCDAEGRYSLYSEGATDENYLRGVQEVDASGQVTFTTIVPGCYPGRWPHIHFEVYESLPAASSGRNAIKTSQLALPQAMCETAYADARYPQSTANLSRLSLSSDNVFSDDGAVHQLAITSGSNEAGYTAVLPVGV